MKNRLSRLDVVHSIVTAVFLMCSLDCASQRDYAIHPLVTEENDAKSTSKPKENTINLYEDAVDKVFTQEIDDFFNIPRHIRNLTNQYKQAKNVNAFDDVPNSTWFTNRNGKRPMSVEELKRGPDRGSGPLADGPLTIIDTKDEGATPGFTIKDRREDIYFIKFDPKGYPELITTAEVISTKFVYAAGYNTPENYLSTFDPKRMRIAENVRVKNRWGKKVPMIIDYVKKLLDKVEANPDGTYRVVASKLLEGKVLGEFHYNGVRKDDPNDHIRHQDRRELRGYRVIAAWLNNSDAKASNTLDTYVTEDNRSFVRHYIIDFGTSLGSSARGPAGPSRGHRGAFDLGHSLLKLLTLGLWVEPWEKESRLNRPSVGHFESRLFKPGNYKFIIPNPAFQRATNLDAFWGAKIVMSFTNEQIRAIVETGKYSNPEDEEYVIKTLIERRDKTGKHWYGKVSPLDNFRVTKSDNQEFQIEFDDLAVKAGFEQASRTLYRSKLRYRGVDLTNYFVSKNKPHVLLTSEILQPINQLAEEQTSTPDDRVFTFRIQTKRGEGGSWGKSVEIYFYYPSENGTGPKIIALEREN